MDDGRQVITTADGKQMVVEADGQMSPVGPEGGSPGKGGAVQMVAAGPAKLEGADRRKLIKEIREEVKPLCSQIAEF